MRTSTANRSNQQLGDWSKWAHKNNTSNAEFFSEALQVMENDFGLGNGGAMTIGLVGSRDIPGVSIRRAQAILRWDRRPSLWSHTFLLAKPRSNINSTRVHEVPLHGRTDGFPEPKDNGVTVGTLGSYDDKEIDANVALLTVARRVEKGKSVDLQNLDRKDLAALKDAVEHPNRDRLRYDLWESLCAWQQYLWSDGTGTNPLRAGVPVPSSAYVEMVYEAMRLDLVPGASERNSAPEHIWNAARWWHQEAAKAREQAGVDVPFVMCGCYVVRDAGASMID